MLSFALSLLTFLAGFLSATYFAWRTAESNAISDHLDDIKQIEALAVSYWLDEDPAQSVVVSHKLRGKLHASEVFRARFGRVLGDKLVEFDELSDRLFDLATGGSFQTASFAQSPATAVELMKVCNELRALLRVARQRIYWAH